eukprot:3272670-Alexandrium_andersonii.AAC.1
MAWSGCSKTPGINEPMAIQHWIDWIEPRKTLQRWQTIATRCGVQPVPTSKRAAVQQILLRWMTMTAPERAAPRTVA